MVGSRTPDKAVTSPKWRTGGDSRTPSGPPSTSWKVKDQMRIHVDHIWQVYSSRGSVVECVFSPTLLPEECGGGVLEQSPDRLETL